MHTTVRSSVTMTAAVLVLAISTVTAAAQSPPAAPKPTADPAQTLPGGASQVQETHGDWRVTCAQQNGQKVCVFSQQQTDKDSRQLVVGIELKAVTSDRAEGTMVLPFGLAVAKPLALQIDDAGMMLPAHFITCVPVGCLVPLTLDAATVANLRKGTLLNVKSAGADNGQEVAFKVSLKGFGSALDRTAALAK